MTPLKFREANTELQAPPGMDNCDPLPVFRYDDPNTRCTVWLSNWRVTWWERLEILVTGKAWLWVHQCTHPPAALEGKNPFRKGLFERPVKLTGWLWEKVKVKGHS